MLKLSLIVPIYGVEKYIERCCISIFEQTYKDFEIVFVNDCTKDKSEEIVLKVINRFLHLNIFTKIIRHEVNQGISATRETGLNSANGEYVLYIDSDDYIAPNMLEELINKAIETNADIVYCDFYEVKNGEQRYCDQTLLTTDPISVTAAMLREEIAWCPWNKIFRRLIAVNNNIHWPVGINLGEDLVVISKLFCYANKIEYVNKPLYFYNRDNVNSYLNSWGTTSCNQNTAAVQTLNIFLKDKFPNPILLEALLQTKLMARYQMIYPMDKQLLEKSVKTFTDTNYKLFSYKRAPFYWKIALYLAINNNVLLLNSSLGLIKILKKIRRYSGKFTYEY